MNHFQIFGSNIICGLLGCAVLGATYMMVVKDRRKATPVDVVRVGYGTVSYSASITGNIRPVRSFGVRSLVSGRVDSIAVSEGMSVDQGVILFKIAPEKTYAAIRRVRTELVSAQSDVQAAKAKWDMSIEEVNRFEYLGAKDLVALKELRNARREAQLSEAQYEGAMEHMFHNRTALHEAGQNLRRTMVRAPEAGTVISINIQAGESITETGNGQTPHMLLADLSKMMMRGWVDEVDIPLISKDQKVEIKLEALPDTLIQGGVSRIARTASSPYGSANDGPVQYEVDVTLRQLPQQVRPGMSAHGKIVTDVRKDILRVPLEAVIENNRVQIVFVVRNDSVHQVVVTTGLSDSFRTEIKEGLQAEDVVVVGDMRTLHQLRDGDKVVIRKIRANDPEG